MMPNARFALAALVFAPAALAVASAQRPPEPAPAVSLRTIASTRAVMNAITKPLSDAVFQAAGEPPTTDAGWTTLGEQAAALAESANMLMIGDRVRDRNEWLQLARAQFDGSEKVAKAVATRDAKGLSEAGDALYESCAACHTKYPTAR